MNVKDPNSFFSFIPQESFITYKKVPLITPEIQKLQEQTSKNNNNIYKPSFFYDKYTNQFLYINGEVVIILDTKCKMKTFSRIGIKEKIKSISIEYNNKYVLYNTYDCKSFIINLEDLNVIDCFENEKFQYLDGFFIPYKTENKEHDYFILCMITRTYFNISRITKRKNAYNDFDYYCKKTFISNKMNIINFNFNHIFKVLLIIKGEPISYCLYNLKSKCCYKTPLIINDIKINENESRLYLQNIYKKLYLIKLTDSIIYIHRLKNLKEKKEPFEINFNTDKKKLNIQKIYLQFYNNFIIVYSEYYIKVYDIKNNNNNYEIYSLNTSSKQYIKIFYNFEIHGKYIIITNEFYKIKFLYSNYRKYSKFCSKDIFFTILRRRNNTHIISQILFEILNNLQISKFFEILEELVIKNKKYIEKRKSVSTKIIYKDIKTDPFKIVYIGNNNFYLPDDYLLGLFNQSFDKSIKPESFIKILGYLYHIYNINNINLDINLFYSSLFCHLNKIDNLMVMEYIIRNKIIPLNEKLGIYFIIRAKGFNDKEKYQKCSNIGIDILLNENKYNDNIIKQITEEFININEYSNAFNLISDSYFQKYNNHNQI